MLPMRRLLLAVPFLIPLCAQAQTTAANPVEPFSYGVRTGTAKNPLVAALSSVVPSASAGPTQAASPVELFSYGRRVGTQSNPLYINLGNALDSYVTQPSLNSTLASYATQTWATDNFIQIVTTGSEPTATGEHHFAYSGTFSDPASGIALDAKFGGSGIGATNVYDSGAVGAGNAYACFSATGKLYRSSTACN